MTKVWLKSCLKSCDFNCSIAVAKQVPRFLPFSSRSKFLLGIGRTFFLRDFLKDPSSGHSWDRANKSNQFHWFHSLNLETTKTMWFCPLDGTLLQITQSSSTQSLYICSTCPYAFPITSNYKFSKKVNLERKIVDDILGGTKAWENVDRTMTVCPSCSHHEAYFMQMQIRSADEPMSVFYKCVKCSHQWSDR